MTKKTIFNLHRKIWMFALTVAMFYVFAAPADLSAATGQPCVTITSPVGVAATPTELLVTSAFTKTIYSFSSCGAPAVVFATLANSNAETYLAISSGSAGFNPGDVYACQGNLVYKIPATGTGTTVPVWVTLPQAPGTETGHCGITFNTAGNLIVTLADGTIWQITAAGAVTQVTTSPGLIKDITEGPSATANALYVTQEKENTVWKISGGVNTVFNNSLVFPESVHVIPNNLACTFDPTASAAFFTTDFTKNQILYYPGSAFTGLSGELLVPLEGQGSATGIYVLDASGVATPFDLSAIAHEGSAFVQCAGTGGFWTGGGSVFTANNTRVTHGFELHCDVSASPNNLEINWDRNNFHLTNLTTVACFYDPRIGSPKPPSAQSNTIVGTGTGTCNGNTGATITFRMTDQGEPGKNDTAAFNITGGGCSLTVVSAKLNSGNQQAH